jgi:hypothetical protein
MKAILIMPPKFLAVFSNREIEPLLGDPLQLAEQV